MEPNAALLKVLKALVSGFKEKYPNANQLNFQENILATIETPNLLGKLNFLAFVVTSMRTNKMSTIPEDLVIQLTESESDKTSDYVKVNTWLDKLWDSTFGLDLAENMGEKTHEL